MFLVPLLGATWLRKIVASRCDAAPRAPRREARQLNPLPILIARMAHIAPSSPTARDIHPRFHTPLEIVSNPHPDQITPKPVSGLVCCFSIIAKITGQYPPLAPFPCAVAE